MKIGARIAWAITGSGHYLSECIDLLSQFERVDIFLSKAGQEVLQQYRYKLSELCPNVKIYQDKTASAVPIGGFYRGVYHTVVIAPATSNTVAKCVLGISDSLITNVYAHAGKCKVPIIVYACDAAPQLDSEAPDGIVTVYPRKIDLYNTELLAKHQGTQVVLTLEELKHALKVTING